jgi:hypothetical protein
VTAQTVTGLITATGLSVPGAASYRVSAHAVIGLTTVKVRHAAAPPHVITAHSDLGSVTISPS